MMSERKTRPVFRWVTAHRFLSEELTEFIRPEGDFSLNYPRKLTGVSEHSDENSTGVTPECFSRGSSFGLA